jgi:hypothetical protein
MAGVKHGDSCCCGSGGGVTIVGCPCAPMPTTLNMVSSKPASNNGIFQSATFTYRPIDAWMAGVALSGSQFLSTTTFRDTVLGADFYYVLLCYQGAYVLTRIYQTTPVGSPFRDGIRYTWFVGLPGNTCSPFSLTLGSIFAGGDATCVVTING